MRNKQVESVFSDTQYLFIVPNIIYYVYIVYKLCEKQVHAKLYYCLLSHSYNIV